MFTHLMHGIKYQHKEHHKCSTYHSIYFLRKINKTEIHFPPDSDIHLLQRNGSALDKLVQVT